MVRISLPVALGFVWVAMFSDDPAFGAEVTGMCVDARTGRPVQGGSVWARSNTLRRSPEHPIQPDGSFSFWHPPGPVILYCHPHSPYPGYLRPDPLNLVLEDAEPAFLRIEASHAWFDGVVLDPHGAPLEGATVTAKYVDINEEWHTLSQEGGSFEIPSPDVFDCGHDVFRLEVTHPDFPEFRGILMEFIVDLPEQKVLRLERTGSVRGRVVDSKGAPVASAEVRVSSPIRKGGMPSQSDDKTVRTDDLGEYRATFILARNDVGIQVQSDRHGKTFRKCEVREGEESLIPDLVLPDTTLSISGRLLDPHGKPVKGATVNGWGNIIGRRKAQSDSRGYFELRYLADETIRVDVAHRDPTTRVYLSGWKNVSAGSSGVEIQLDPPPERRRSNSARSTDRENTGSVTGRVVDADGAPIASAQVRIGLPVGGDDTSSKGVSRMVRTDERGVYHLNDVPPLKRVLIWAETDLHGQAKFDYEIRKGTELRAADLTLPETSLYIAGRVLDPAGRPMTEARVKGWGKFTGWRGTTTDTDGFFRLGPLAHESVQVSCTHPDPDTQFHLAGRKAVPAGSSSVEIHLVHPTSQQGSSKQCPDDTAE